MKEITLVNELGEPEAYSVSLDDLKTYILSLYPEFDVEVHYDDYDIYGCEHYLEIVGSCAKIVLIKNYGGMFCPTDFLECSVETLQGRDPDGHDWKFHLKKPVKEINIGRNYSQSVKKYLVEHVAFLKADNALFYRIDQHNWNDSSGVHHALVAGKWRRSFDIIHISDRDFYVAKEVDLSIRSIKKDIDEQAIAEANRQRYVFVTELGTILVEEYMDYDALLDDDVTDQVRWLASHVTNERYAHTSIQNSIKEAYSRVYQQLSREEESRAWHSIIINQDKLKMWGVVHDMHKKENHIFGGGLLIGWGQSKREAAYQAHFHQCCDPTEVEQKRAELDTLSDKKIIGEFDIYPLSDLAVDYFGQICNNGQSISVLIVNNRIEKESLEVGEQVMTAHEWAKLA